MAVYTQIHPAELASLLRLYALPPLLRYQGIAEGISNTNYHLFFKTAVVPS